ncbi:hypothetical protein Plhal304r1_c011g0043651 [Plasmopara halstedii]
MTSRRLQLGVNFIPQVAKTIGSHNMLRTFTIIRCSVLSILKVYHNDRLMTGIPSNPKYVLQRTKAYVNLHSKSTTCYSVSPVAAHKIPVCKQTSSVPSQCRSSEDLRGT